jgi:hypothetical protein
MRKSKRPIRPAVIAAAVAAAIPAFALADTPITQFTPGDYLILRGGDTTVNDGTNFMGEVNMYLDEYSQSGYYVGTLDLPNMTLPGEGLSNHEGMIDISPNGQWVSFVGYDANTDGTGTTASPAGQPITPTTTETIPRAVDGTESAIIGEANLTQGPSSLNLSTTIAGNNLGNGTSLTGTYVRSAITEDGNEF